MIAHFDLHLSKEFVKFLFIYIISITFEVRVYLYKLQLIVL